MNTTLRFIATCMIALVATTSALAANPTRDLVTIDKSNSKLIIYYPEYDSVDLVCSSTSLQNDPKAIFSCAAAFTSDYLDKFDHKNINGNHVSSGKLHVGSLYQKDCFIWYKGTWKFAHRSASAQTLKTAAANGGMGFPYP